MKKNTLFIILIVSVLLVVIIYYQSSLSKSKITSSTVKTPTGMVVEEQNIEEQEEKEIPVEAVEEKTIEEKPIEKEFPKTFLTDVKCINGREIIFTLNNILKNELVPSKLTFYAAGYTIRNPVCDKEKINPGESTDCELNFNLKLNKIIKFTIAYPGKSQSVNVDCGK